MQSKEQKVTVTDKELNIQKVQALMGYFQTRINVSYTVIFAFIVGFLIFLGSLYYQGVFKIFDESNYNFEARIGNLTIFGITLLFFFLAMRPSLKRLNYHRDNCLKIVDELFNKISCGESLTSLVELKKLEYPEKNKKGKLLSANQTNNAPMSKNTLSKKELGNIAVACIFISLGIGFTSMIALSFQGIFSGSIIVFPIMFIVATLVWAGLIFVLVIYSPLFRNFFLKWFAISDDDNNQTKLMNQVLLEQKEIKENLMTLTNQLKDNEKKKTRDLTAKPTSP